MRRFVVLGQRASASPDFSLDDLPSSSGRLDVLARCLRAALLVFHGLRQDTLVYLVLGGGPRAPRTLRIDGAAARFVRPDERSLAILIQKTLATVTSGHEFVEMRAGIAVADAGLEALLPTLAPCSPFVLDEQGQDARESAGFGDNPVFFVGDHLGFEPEALALLGAFGARPVSVGPRSLHAEDAVTLIVNELDRRGS